ncbi:MAG: hypothetical protein KH006_06975 [Firmicutes bacterium]|nr:hypothetical protein [Bacillota bacterium]
MKGRNVLSFDACAPTFQSGSGSGASAISKALVLAAFFAYFLPLLAKSMPPKA